MIPPTFVVLQIPSGGEEGTAALLNLAVGLFAVILLALSLNAYRKTKLRRLLLVSAAFGFFALSVVIRNIEIFLLPGIDVDEVLVTTLELVMLLLFFLALVLKD
jgi:ABC-type polysaccharide transport system permease subunit